VIEAASIRASGNLFKYDLVHIEDIRGKGYVHVDALLCRLNHKCGIIRVYTMPSRPSIIAMRPPVLVPPMRSKYSHGLGASLWPVFTLTAVSQNEE
jgi:hypothetical protein